MKVLFSVFCLLLGTPQRWSFPQTPARPDSEKSKILALENTRKQAEEHKAVKAL
jgi:hypothetical protein